MTTFWRRDDIRTLFFQKDYFRSLFCEVAYLLAQLISTLFIASISFNDLIALIFYRYLVNVSWEIPRMLVNRSLVSGFLELIYSSPNATAISFYLHTVSLLSWENNQFRLEYDFKKKNCLSFIIP